MRKPFQWALSSFYVGDQMTSALVPFVGAAPTEEQQVFLTTQLADEARHTVFFDRFYDEVLDEGTEMDSHREAGGGGVSSGYRILLLEMLPEVTERIRRLDDPDALVEGIVLYHIVVEATIALTGQRFLLNHAPRTLATRLQAGFDRDCSRRVPPRRLRNPLPEGDGDKRRPLCASHRRGPHEVRADWHVGHRPPEQRSELLRGAALRP